MPALVGDDVVDPGHLRRPRQLRPQLSAEGRAAWGTRSVRDPRRGQARTPLHTLLRAGQSPKTRLRIVQLLAVPTELRKNLQTVTKDCLR